MLYRLLSITISQIDDLARELLGTVMKAADLVDANVLMYLWPKVCQLLHYHNFSEFPIENI